MPDTSTNNTTTRIGSASAGVRGMHCMVATGNPLASAAAQRMLAQGGSAVDAAIAADAALGVVEPMATSIGGDALAVVVECNGNPVAYNGTGRAPLAFSEDLLRGLPKQRIPERHGLSVTTPGAVRGWWDLHQRYGLLDWAALFGPAIAAARNGFTVAPVAAREWALFEPVLHRDPECARLYRAGAVPRAGDRFVNPELALVLDGVAKDGPSSFYEGAPARAAARANRALGGVLETVDFEQHRGNFCAPVTAQFRGLSIVQTPPNTHGISVLDALSQLECSGLDPDDPQTMVQAVQCMGAAMQRAQQTVADPSGNTVCTVVVDRTGLAITLMTSIFKRFGSGIAVPGCGFVLQNRGFGFAQPGHVNAPGPGKRPYHTVVPGAALKDGRFHAGFGVVGGAMQPQGQVQILLRTAAWQQPLQDALDAPRWRLESESALAIEQGMPAPVVKALREAGFGEASGRGELGGRSDFGGAQWIIRDEVGLLGASDKRKDGLAWGE